MQKSVKIGDIVVNADIEDGARGRAWLTFSNSHATDLSLWDGQADRLKNRYRILRYDTRGHGGSDATPGSYTIGMLGEDLVKLWDALGIEQSALIGLSLGGTTALEVAAGAPDRVTAVLACDCRHFVTPDFTASWEPRIELARSKGMEALVASTTERWFSAAYRDREPPELERVRAMIRATSVNGYIGCARALQTIDVVERLNQIACPVHIITGRADPAAPPDLIADMASRIAGATTGVIEDAAHITNLEQPAAFNAELERFFERSLG